MVVLLLACITFPVRVLTAVQRERMLELNIYNLRIELDNLSWENKQLQERLQTAVEDRKVVETVFAEIEDEYDRVVAQAEQLENEMQKLKEHNNTLKEIQEKGRWDYESVTGDFENVQKGIPVGAKHAFQPWITEYDQTGLIPRGIYDHATAWAHKKSRDFQPHDSAVSVSSAVQPYPHVSANGSTADEVMHQHRYVALSQSLFSTFLSLLVGAIIWEAEDPCMPLVAALFTVVGMSLSSVVQFVTLKNKPASDAIALLSLNWFVLGTITSPALPRLVRSLSYPVTQLISHPLGWIGFPL